jgi:predicted MFS family arabinose efflux permease
VIFSLVPLGSVLGVPAGTFIGEVAGWRTAFVTMGILSVVVFAALVITVPALSPQRPTRMSELGKMLRGTNTRFALTMTFLIVIAHFSTYTYVTPFLEDVTLAGSFTITVVLLAFGAAGMAGNFICGSTVSRYPRATFAAVAAAIAAATMLLPVLGHGLPGAITLLTIWGIAYGGVPVCSQTWFAKAAPQSIEASSVLFTASFQATIAVGALAGGLVVDRFSPAAIMAPGGVIALLMALVAYVHHAKRVHWSDPLS